LAGRPDQQGLRFRMLHRGWHLGRDSDMKDSKIIVAINMDEESPIFFQSSTTASSPISTKPRRNSTTSPGLGRGTE
jgi:hypothetical protein